MAFTNEQLERYSRHIILKEVGAKGQKKLLNSSVLIIGAGGLGSPAALYLAAAGVGTIGPFQSAETDYPCNKGCGKTKGTFCKRIYGSHQPGCDSKNLPDFRRF